MELNLTFVAQIAIFLVMVWLLRRWLYEPLNSLMEARARKIAEGLAAAEDGLRLREEAEREAGRQLDEARAKAHEIITAAERRSQEMLEEARVRAREEAEGILEAAREEIAGELAKAKRALREEVAEIALLAAERIVSAELSAKRHQEIIDRVLEERFGGEEASR